MPADTRREQDQAARRTRIPTGGNRLRLDARPREGYVPRYVIDNPGRIQQMREHGYEIAQAEHYGRPSSTDLGTNISLSAGRNTPERLILMEQRKDYYQEDQAAKQADIDQTMGQIAKGHPEGEGASRENHNYVPEARPIRIERR